MRQAALFTPSGIVEINESTGNEAAVGFIADLKETQPNLIAGTLAGAGLFSARGNLAEAAYGRFAGAGNLFINAAVVSASVSGWLNELGSNINLYASIDEAVADDTDYIASSSTPGDSVRFSLSDVSSVINPTMVRYRYKKHTDGDISDTGTVNLQARLQQGTTTIAQWEHDDIGTSFVTVEQSLTDGEFSSITDFTDLYLQFATLGGWWLTGASIDLDFSNNMHYDSSNPTATFTDLLSCSRASIGYATNADGTLTSFANDALRIGVGTGLLVEDARTNDILYSQDYTHAGGWSLVSLVTPTSGVAAPDGTSTAWKVVADTTAGSNHNFQQSVSIAAVNYTVSIFAKAAEYNFANLELAINSGTGGRYSINVNLTTGAIESSDTTGSPVVVSTGTELYGNGWVRIWIVVTATAGALYAQISPCPTATPTYSNSIPIYTGDNTSGVYFWGVQFEVGSFPSSFIPTTTVAATRAADVMTVTGNLDTVLKSSAVSIVADAKMNAGVATTAPNLIATSGNFFVLYSVGSYNIIRTYDGAVELGATLGASATFFNGAKVGLAGDSGGRSIVGNGGTVASDANDIPALTGTIRLMYASGDPLNQWWGYFRRLTIWNIKLADATLQALTAP